MPRGNAGRKAAEVTTNDALDETQDQEQTYRTGQVSEGDLDLMRRVASPLGWTPKEQWQRDPAKWEDADKFLERTATEVQALKERNRELQERTKRTAQAAADAIEDQRRQARQEALAEVRAATEAQDADRSQRAAERLAQVSGPPPQTVAWMGRNTWFNEDPDAQLLAAHEINRLAASGASIEDQLAAAETKVKRRFPEYFDQAEDREEPRETRLSESRRIAPAVQAGTRNGTQMQQPKEKAFGDVPRDVQASYRKYFAKKFEEAARNEGLRMGKPITPEQARMAGETRYAASYWRNQQ